jgi:hypothetical protein
MKERHSRQSFLGLQSPEIIANVKIGIVGLGGGGSHIVQQLAHIGVQNFVLCDHDTVEESNLNRLVGATAKDAADTIAKTKIAERLIHNLNREANYRLITKRWQEETEHLAICDIIFGCVDSFQERDQLERFSRRFLIPYIDIGMDVLEQGTHFLMTGQVVRSMPGEPCLWCLGVINKKLIAEEAKKYGAAGGKPQVVWPNGVLASTAIGLFTELITPWHQVGRPVACLEYDGNRHTIEPSNVLGVVKDGECHHYSLKEVGDPFFSL